MSYSYYLEGYSGECYIRHYIQGYKTLQGLEKARKTYCESHKVAVLGYCKFSFNGSMESKYNPASYKIIDRFNCKPFFEFWG